MKTDQILTCICFGLAALLIYGQYFVASSEYEHLSYQMSGSLFIILGFFTILLGKLTILEEGLKKTVDYYAKKKTD